MIPNHINNSEIIFFNAIKSKCDIIFDIGCRTDTYYIELSPSSKFHLFEPNKQFCKELLNTDIIKSSNTIVNNFGLGKETISLPYYLDSQSFFDRRDNQGHYRLIANYDTNMEILNIKEFMKYITDNDIHNIDFIKMDVEGSEPDILLNGSSFINNNVKYVQFEYASTWLDRKDNIAILDIYNMFVDNFNFYFLLDHKHPISKKYPLNITLLNKDMLSEIEQYMKNDYGFNIVMMIKR
jgi:FkbM family methyltransferase